MKIAINDLELTSRCAEAVRDCIQMEFDMTWDILRKEEHDYATAAELLEHIQTLENLLALINRRTPNNIKELL